MKKIKNFLLCVPVLLVAAGVPALAQDDQSQEGKDKEKPALKYGYFNHLGVGVSVGIMDGLSASLGVPVGAHFQVRGGYALLPFTPKYTVDDLGSYDVNGTSRDFTDIDISATLTSSYYGMVDIYPSKKAAFHFTVGAYGSSDGNLLNLKADVSRVLLRSEYASAFVELNDVDTGNRARISSDKDGFLHVDVQAKNKIRPYFGLGWGREANIKHRVSVSFDMGLQYVGGIQVAGYDYDGNAQILTSGLVEHNDSALGQDDIIDKVADGKLFGGVVGNWWPVMKFGINVRLF